VHRIVEASYAEVLTVLGENRPRLDLLAAALLEHETLDEADAYAAAGIDRPRNTVGGLAAAARSVTAP
jgi:cell division protease FtsH